MRFWSRFVTASLVLVMALSWAAVPAAAKKKKKKVVEEETRTVERHETRMDFEKHPMNGLNMQGKPGYFISDTAETLNKGQIAGSVNLTFDTWGNVFQIPVGVSYGITDKLLVNVNSAFYSYGGSSYTTPYGTVKTPGVSGLSYLDFGGKYGFDVGNNPNLHFAGGLDFGIGPLSNLYGFTSAFAIDPYGVCTYTFRDGLQLNGKLGLYIQNYSLPTYFPPPLPSSYSYSYTYFQGDFGVAYPFDKKLTGIAELATNGVISSGAIGGGTPLLVGIRSGDDSIRYQGFIGSDFGGTVGLYVGAGIAFYSK